MEYDKKIGLVTVLYNSGKVLDAFFNSLEIQSNDNINVYIVDNCSSDDSLEKTKLWSRKTKFKVSIIENHENYGIAKGNNQGIIKALADDCDYVLLSNNDIEFPGDTIEKLYTGLIDTKADMIVPKIFFYDTDKLWFAGGYFKKLNCMGIQNGYNKNDLLKYNSIKKITYAPTCFMLISKKTFYSVGLMDEDYFVYWDDTDFVYRAMKFKKRLIYFPAVFIRHKESSCSGNRSDFFYENVYMNQIIFILKNCKIKKLRIWLLFLYHFTVRNIKLSKNRHLWNLILQSMIKGLEKKG